MSGSTRARWNHVACNAALQVAWTRELTDIWPPTNLTGKSWLEFWSRSCRFIRKHNPGRSRIPWVWLDLTFQGLFSAELVVISVSKVPLGINLGIVASGVCMLLSFTSPPHFLMFGFFVLYNSPVSFYFYSLLSLPLTLDSWSDNHHHGVQDHQHLCHHHGGRHRWCALWFWHCFHVCHVSLWRIDFT